MAPGVASQEWGDSSKALCRRTRQWWSGASNVSYVTSHVGCLEEEAVMTSPIVPKFCRISLLFRAVAFNFCFVAKRMGSVVNSVVWNLLLFPLGFLFPDNWLGQFCGKFYIGTSRTLHDAGHIPKKMLSILSPVGLRTTVSWASWRTEFCDTQFSQACGQQFAVNRDSLKLRSKATLCFAESGGWMHGHLRVWPSLLTPKDHSCALIEYVHEYLTGWDQHKHPWVSSSLLCLFCKVNDHQTLRTWFWPLEMLRCPCSHF